MLSKEPLIQGRPAQVKELLERAKYINAPQKAQEPNNISDDINNYFFGDSMQALYITGKQAEEKTPVGIVNHPSPIDVTSVLYPVSIFARLGENIYNTLKSYSKPASANIELPDDVKNVDHAYSVYDMISKSNLCNEQKQRALEIALPDWFPETKHEAPITQMPPQSPVTPATAPVQTTYSSQRKTKSSTTRKTTRKTTKKSTQKGRTRTRKPWYSNGREQKIEGSFNNIGDHNNIKVVNGDNYETKTSKEMNKILKDLYKW